MLENDVAVRNASIQVENINGPIFFVSATRDEVWPSTEMSESMVHRLSENDFPHFVDHLAVNGDHASVLDNFDEVEDFLKVNFMQDNSSGCPR